MTEFEAVIRLSIFFGLLTALGVWEVLAPRRKLAASKPARWLSNLSLLAINALAVRLLFALGLVGVAYHAEAMRWGALHHIDLPYWLEVVIAAVLLDLAIYAQHVLFHAVPLLWRLHMVHHADPDFDVTTGLRFHTLEIGLSVGIKVGAIIVLGAPAAAVLLFEVLLNATSMFNHSNIQMPAALDAALRWLVVTPDMHRVHHSTDPQETNSNYGFNVPWWDYLFRTYKPAPARGHEEMHIGLEYIPAAKAVWLHWLLALPVAVGIERHPRSGNKEERSAGSNEDSLTSADSAGRPPGSHTESTMGPFRETARSSHL